MKIWPVVCSLTSTIFLIARIVTVSDVVTDTRCRDTVATFGGTFELIRLAPDGDVQTYRKPKKNTILINGITMCMMYKEQAQKPAFLYMLSILQIGWPTSLLPIWANWNSPSICCKTYIVRLFHRCDPHNGLFHRTPGADRCRCDSGIGNDSLGSFDLLKYRENDIIIVIATHVTKT